MPRIRRSRSRSGRRGAQRRKLDWQRTYVLDILDGVPDSETVDAFWIREPADTGIDEFNQGFSTSVVQEDLTLVRTRPTLKGSYLARDESGTPQLGAVTAGIIVWEGNDGNTQPDFALVPSPFYDGGADWIWHWSMGGVTPGLTANNFLINESSTFGPESLNDVRAQRKLSSRQGLAFIISIVNFHPTVYSRFAYMFYARTLFKLP